MCVVAYESKAEALCVLLSRLAMPSRVEVLEQRFFRCLAAITEIFYEALECFLQWVSVGIYVPEDIFAK
jgi:hypothetical protein